ncbi:MAG: hydrogenase maturation protease [Candidatus Omnitrophica bacterium]|nr:hydrogenase maturation protease [Candidatus Omnitrophota bacterium]MDE2214429.1 hydrogenase maturation protease [Candidatus Omnitrophota bacterium]MDE2231569.1 hydrogenase maturation protease [Candidatus Omnitrophota bacterium]
MSLKGDRPANILVVGIGNPLRCDDGVGPYIAGCIETRGLSGVHVRTVQQLLLEDLEEMLQYDQVILADASVSGPPVDFRPVEKFSGQLLSSSHHLSAELFVNLAAGVYHKDLKLHLCCVKGLSFEVGDKISDFVLQRAGEAVDLIAGFINNMTKGKV